MFDVLDTIMDVWDRFVSVAALLTARFNAHVTLGRGVKFRGLPLIQISQGGRIAIGDGVVLNSLNRNYHLNMYGPVKLMADRPGARIEIGEQTRIHGSCLHAYALISVGKRCLIAANCQIIDGNGHQLCLEKVQDRTTSTDVGRPIVIEDDVWLGAGTFVLPGVTIGRGSIVGAGSVVTRDIPPMAIAAGSPAKVIRRF
jgi:acetyltransferase-like isoleucine patch superfamily enzyme